MPVPEKLQQAIDFARQQVEQDDHHSLLPKDRLPIYKAIDELGMPLSKQLNAQLALITAQKVLPLWEMEQPDDTLFQDILSSTQKLFDGKLSPQEADEKYMLYYSMVGSDYYSEELNNIAYQSLETAYHAFCIGLGFKPFEGISPFQMQVGFPDDILIHYPTTDTACSAVIAYSGYAYDDEVFPTKLYLMSEKDITDAIAKYKQTFYPYFQKEKCLEFWHWWLDKAIPEACKLIS